MPSVRHRWQECLGLPELEVMKQKLVTLFLLFAVSTGSGPGSGTSCWAQPPVLSSNEAQAAVDEIGQLVEKHFFDPKLKGLDWPSLVLQTRQAAASQPQKLDEQANRLLSQLQSSHTRYFPCDTQGFHELCGVFGSMGFFPQLQKRAAYRGAGWFLYPTPQGTFIKNVWPGFAAEKAGLRVGDMLLDIDGQPPTSLAALGKDSVAVRFRRTAQGPLETVQLQPEQLDPMEAFLEAQRRSAKVEKTPQGRIGYVAMRCYAGDQFQELLESQLQKEPLRDCDALVLDLRDGWGGASPQYLDIFSPQRPFLQLMDRNGKRQTFGSSWRRPVAFLINGGTTSGKEVLAFGLQKNRWGILVGEKTAGALLGGRAYLLNGERGLLYLAVSDAIVDGVRLEGVGVSPDLAVARSIPYCGGVDPQYHAAVEALAKKIRKPQ